MWHMRASQALKAQRLNHARSLLEQFPHLPDALAQMVHDSALSPRQAYRYLQQPRRLKRPVPVSDAKIAFTVKLSRKLVEQVRTRAQEAGLSLSELVSRALWALLARRRGHLAEPFVPRRRLQFQYQFDRLLPDKLQQVYQLLVPDHVRPISGSVTTSHRRIAMTQAAAAES
jgi:hypothetical protein